MLYFDWWSHFLLYYYMSMWRRPTTIGPFFHLTKLSLKALQPYLVDAAQLSCLWVGFQPITLLELSRRIQRELVPKWTWPLKLIINSDPSCIIVRYSILGCRWPREMSSLKLAFELFAALDYLCILKQVLKG